MSLKPAAATKPASARFIGLAGFTAILGVLLLLLFLRGFHPSWVVFANDGPLGALKADHAQVPEMFTGGWADLNSYGSRDTGAPPDLTFGFLLLAGPLGFAKLYALFTLLFLGVSAWFFFRQLGLGPLAAMLGGLATALCSDFFGVSCWGVGSQALCFGLNYLALAVVVSPQPLRPWIRYPLAGLAVGMGVMEAFDIGAIFSVVTAICVVGHALLAGGNTVKNFAVGCGRVATIGVFAGLVAAAALSTLIGTQVQGVAGAEQDSRSKLERWDWATQWSFPKAEALGIVVPGVFGFRMDTPDGGNYWGKGGRDPAWDRYFASGKQGAPPRGFMRYGGGGSYTGVLVVLVALWALLQSLRKEHSVFAPNQRKLIWFLTGVAGVSLLMSFGRFAPFYQFFYALPYASTIRNPGKFMHVFQWVLLIIFAHGIYGLSHRYLEVPAVATRDLVSQLQAWWAKVSSFDRKWTIGCALALGASLLGWLIYGSARARVLAYLQEVQFDEAMAKAIATFSLGQVGWFILFLALSVGLFTLVLSGYFNGRRARTGGLLLGLLLVVDLARVDTRFVVTYNWKERYESSPVLDFLRTRPYEQRVAIFPFDRFVNVSALPRELRPLVNQYSMFAQLYGLEWTQHLFQYYNIQSLDIVQEPRVAADKAAFEAVMAFAPVRRWELSNTRYLLGPMPMLDFFNQQIDVAQKRMRVAARFDLVPKPESQDSSSLQQITTLMNTNGQFAVFDFTGALPRASLYANWKVSTNEPAILQAWVKDLQSRMPAEMGSALANQDNTNLATLKDLADPAFDPAQTVLLAEPLASPGGTNGAAGEVKFESYAPKHIVLKAQTAAPAVLLLNDKYDPNWQVTVDGQPAKLLRCNFIMRGVYLDKPGSHRIEFKFLPATTGLYVSLAGLTLGLLLVGYVSFSKRGAESSAPPPDPAAKNSPKK